MLWFDYDKKSNIFCVLTFILSIINLVSQFVWLSYCFDEKMELFQAPGINYGDVVCCYSIIIILISIFLIWGGDNYLIFCNIAKYLIVLFQFVQILLEWYHCYDGMDQKVALFCIFQPVPLLLAMVVHIMNNLSTRLIVFVCIFDYVLFLGKEYILSIKDWINFYMIFSVTDASILRLLSSLMFVFILLTGNFLTANKR